MSTEVVRIPRVKSWTCSVLNPFAGAAVSTHHTIPQKRLSAHSAQSNRPIHSSHIGWSQMR